MKKQLFILTSIAIFFTVNAVYGVDYYSEMGMDPFYSSLNPAFIDEQEEFTSKQDSVVNVIKQKRQERAEKRAEQRAEKAFLKEQKKLELIEKKKKEEEELLRSLFDDLDIDEDIKNKDNDEYNYDKDKKSKSKTDLEKELRDEEREKQKALEEQLKKEREELSFKDKFLIFTGRKKQKTKVSEVVDPNIEFTADYMEYFPDRYEVEAVGNAMVNFKSQAMTLTANKIIFNYDKNVLKANENVVLTSPDSVTEGDFVKIDLSKPSGWIETPVTKTEDIKLSAKEAFIFSDKIVEYDGVAKILKDETLSIGARSFASYIDQGRIFQHRISRISEENKGVYKLKANTIVIDSKDDHEEIIVKNADLYLKNFRLARIPSMKIVTNKKHASVETNLPELGSESMLGMHFGPAVVLNVPGGSTLKLAPLITYKDDRIGVGGLARFRNQYNMTEVAYGTSKDELVIRGRHKLAPGLMLNYSRFANQNQWFLGYRRPKYSAELNYSTTNYIKDLDLRFSQRYSAGAFIDNRRNVDWGDLEGRFRWMTQTHKPIYKYKNEEGNIGVNFGVVAQTVSTVYTTGDTVGLFRFGPMLNTKVGPWNQTVMYYQTAQAGQSPFYFDRYRYGRSNVVFVESLRICKYLTVGYMASLAMNRDVKSDDLLQENRLLLSIGPEYARLTIGYDSFRRNTMLSFAMLVGTKDSDVAFKKAEIRNPDKFGKKKSKQKKSKKKSYKKYLKEDA